MERAYTWRIGDVFTNGTYRWKVDSIHGDKAVLRSCGSSWATTIALTFDEWREGGRWQLEKCCSDFDPACPTHGIAASNARQNDYWRRVGGHPDAGEVDAPEPERCLVCEVRLDPEFEPNYPYCSTQCAIESENDNAND